MSGQPLRHKHGRAVVIGGSMVGMAVARALSDHFDEVVVIDKDHFPRAAPEHRRNVPQSWHIHNLTLRGQREIEELLPGFVEAAVALGAMQIDHALDVAAFTSLGWEPRFESGFIALSATRILLEFAQRQRFFELVKNAVVLEGTRVTSLLVADEGKTRRAIGVATDNAQHAEIHADLIVDCAGRSSSWKSWLKSHDVALPKETLVDSRCGYSSRFYRPRNPATFNWKALIVDAICPDRPEWGVIVPLENNDWVVTLGGFNDQYPPGDERGFMEFARKLPTPAYYEALQQADPLTPVRTFRKLEMRWNHFENYDHPLERFMVLGDSAWAYNPLYGQGMSIGTTCARILRDVLREDADLRSLPFRFYPRAKKFAWDPWEATALMDMRWPKTQGKRPWHSKLTIPLTAFVLDAGHYDEYLYLGMLQAIHLLKQPSELVSLRSIYGVLRYTFKRLLSLLPPLNRLPSPPAPTSKQSQPSGVSAALR
jgi:flavin-dependent dehydrogenase